MAAILELRGGVLLDCKNSLQSVVQIKKLCYAMKRNNFNPSLPALKPDHTLYHDSYAYTEMWDFIQAPYFILFWHFPQILVDFSTVTRPSISKQREHIPYTARPELLPSSLWAAGWNRDDYRMNRVPGQIDDKFRTGVPILSPFCPAAGCPGRKWQNGSVLSLSSICPCHKSETQGVKCGQKWDSFETNDDKN